ncbi:Nitrogen regulation protein NR(I) [Rhodobacteraceae bacterium THAF1]|uniref:nitrogen assimilation response regulator NtrX n=1 Tax=Palleronia sp. THAF1 TaxID=2587842 RepID=UPI000F3EAAE4|nr:sigma-54 dependent transcriptional regulator [Palleronia sp. THAF1]QFU08572.1 Nitrogen regulation protein NR(I) [Palleronia sp. THAF1]VDC30640.1 Nitrogen regulation protein NR(I) [Rhodobacteraceae bacterium THAF1]
MGDILIVDDERDIRELIGDILEDEGYTCRRAANSHDCMAEIEKSPPAMMILDIWLKDSDMDGIDILKIAKRDYPGMPVIIISGHGNIEIAVAAIKQGAYDYIEKPFNIDQLMVVIGRAMETSKLRRENVELKRRDVEPPELIGSSPAFRGLKASLDKVTRSNGRVMLTGPSGSGKELAARYIHANSGRADFPFITVGAAAIEPDRMEEVLFGRETERGSEPGLLEEADGGVLFFDEIADMPLGTQSKILRVLVDQAFTRVGGTEKVKVDIRVISSTNRDLAALAEEGMFRQELYHRLAVVPIEVPALDDRREDIPELAEFFLSMFNRTQGLPLRRLSEEAQAMLQTMIWPGNVRQLKNMVERVLILGEDKGDITAAELPGSEAGPSEEQGRVVLSGSLAMLPLREARELFEREYLLTQINRFGGNISRTANFVGMERSALHRKLKSLGVVTTSKQGARIAHLDEQPVG